MQKNISYWMLAAILTICGVTMVSCFSDSKKSAAVSATDDASQFVTFTVTECPQSACTSAFQV